ncbi:hypothetical protein D1007_03180 [Hordeum vulgare]|nr:hypothetical protein D1007_03180 [Hordeum vulgare]
MMDLINCKGSLSRVRGPKPKPRNGHAQETELARFDETSLEYDPLRGSGAGPAGGLNRPGVRERAPVDGLLLAPRRRAQQLGPEARRRPLPPPPHHQHHLVAVHGHHPLVPHQQRRPRGPPDLPVEPGARGPRRRRRRLRGRVRVRARAAGGGLARDDGRQRGRRREAGQALPQAERAHPGRPLPPVPPAPRAVSLAQLLAHRHLRRANRMLR